ncbi:membrane-associated protein, putative, partial [Bodo saltans]
MSRFWGLFRAVLVFVIVVYPAAPIDFNTIKCNNDGAVVTCFLECRLIVSTTNDENLILSSGSGVLISGGNLSVYAKSSWPTYSVAGGPGSPNYNVFHAQFASFTCSTNCCPSNGTFINNLLNANSTVTYVCGVVTEVVPPEGWRVVTSIVGARNTTAIGSMVPLSSPTIRNEAQWCVPTQSGSYSPPELQYLTPPFLVPAQFFGSSVQRIGMTQVSFAEAFNCSQERGYLTSVTQEITLYDQFSPFRTTNLLTNSFATSTTKATYINSTYNDVSGLLQSTVRVMGPLYVVLDRSVGVPKPLVLVAPLLALIYASNVGSSTIVQLAPSYRAPTPASSLAIVTTCTNIVGEGNTSSCHSIALDDVIGVNNKIVAVCVQEKPVPLNTSWRVVANRSIREVSPQAPLIISVPLNSTTASQRCRVD